MDPRVTGAQRYSVEVERPGMLHAAFVRSPHPHARILSIDASAAPEDVVVLLPEDVADTARYGCQVRDQHVLADVARFAGDVVAAVAAPTRAAARAAARAVEVSYEELPAVFDALDAVAPGAPQLHTTQAASAAGRGVDRRPPDRRHQRLPPLPHPPRRHRRRGSPTPTWSSRRSSARPAPPTRRWSRTPRSPSGRTGGSRCGAGRRPRSTRAPTSRGCSASSRSASA